MNDSQVLHCEDAKFLHVRNAKTQGCEGAKSQRGRTHAKTRRREVLHVRTTAYIPEALLPVVIFTTAHDQHALRAFEVNALDYLLKPFKPARLKEAVQRARDLIANREAGVAARGLLALLGQAPSPAGQLTRLAVKAPGKVTFVELDQIHAIEAAGKYAVVHVGKENHVLRETMSSLESHLPPQRFLRISRSVIVNVDQVQELQPMFNGENLVVLKNGKSYPTTRPIREIQQKLEFR